MKKYIVSALIIVLVGLVVASVLTLPRYEEMVWARQRLSAQKEALRAEEARLAELTAIRQRLLQQSAALEKASSSLPLYPDAMSIFLFVRTKAGENGLMVSGAPSVSTEYITGRSGSAGIRSVEMGISLAGPYPALRGFVRSLESSARLIRVTNISSREGEDGGPTHQLTLEAFYYQN